MIKRLALALLLLMAAAPAHAWLAQKAATAAGTTTLLFSGTPSGVSTDVYLPVGYSGDTAASTSNFSMLAVAGNFTEIRAYAQVAPTSTQTWAITLQKNGSDSALTCTITSATSQKCSGTGSIAFAVGDYAALKLDASNSPNASRIKIVLVFTSTTANETPLMAQGVTMSNSATQAVNVSSNSPPGAVAARRWNGFPDDGTVDHFYAQSNAPGAGTSYAYTVVKNGSGTTATCSIADTATSCNDTTHSFSVTGASGSTKGDDVLFQGAPTSTPASATAAFGARYVPTTAGRFAIMLAPANSNSGTSTTYWPMSGGATIGGTTEANSNSLGATMTIEKISVTLTAAPGAGKSRAFTLRKGGSDTACTVTIADTATANTASCSVSVANDDLIVTSDVPTGTPATSQPGISYLAVR